jgi:hypothetical protein
VRTAATVSAGVPRRSPLTTIVRSRDGDQVPRHLDVGVVGCGDLARGVVGGGERGEAWRAAHPGRPRWERVDLLGGQVLDRARAQGQRQQPFAGGERAPHREAARGGLVGQHPVVALARGHARLGTDVEPLAVAVALEGRFAQQDRGGPGALDFHAHEDPVRELDAAQVADARALAEGIGLAREELQEELGAPLLDLSLQDPDPRMDAVPDRGGADEHHRSRGEARTRRVGEQRPAGDDRVAGVEPAGGARAGARGRERDRGEGMRRVDGIVIRGSARPPQCLRQVDRA